MPEAGNASDIDTTPNAYQDKDNADPDESSVIYTSTKMENAETGYYDMFLSVTSSLCEHVQPLCLTGRERFFSLSLFQLEKRRGAFSQNHYKGKWQLYPPEWRPKQAAVGGKSKLFYSDVIKGPLSSDLSASTPEVSVHMPMVSAPRAAHAAASASVARAVVMTVTMQVRPFSKDFLVTNEYHKLPMPLSRLRRVWLWPGTQFRRRSRPLAFYAARINRNEYHEFHFICSRRMPVRISTREAVVFFLYLVSQTDYYFPARVGESLKLDVVYTLPQFGCLDIPLWSLLMREICSLMLLRYHEELYGIAQSHTLTLCGRFLD
ncbi:hypothetical protein C8Q69DRAFT_447131 [Paecilomyces variotii]|uniref:Uncharacterized protein n=1 Tax=Byssochlamys spectabilis TaxID=264951 RepID=A0A443HMG5_BYSSP|nr:hypothetical protein C8Q69DRAFT_447131 [Paecilomyces variotii]RWQ93005.1 hypothetical protein C8Q69DRAFT_447131 [Paecilomyces variotii]